MAKRKQQRRRRPRVEVRGDLADRQGRRPRGGPHWYNVAGAVIHDYAGRMEFEKLPETVLAFSCLQAPDHHPDTVPFLLAVKAAYAANFSICLGDELDLKFLKKHFMDGDSLGPTEELERGTQLIKDLGRAFPKLILLTSNHIHSRLAYAGGQANLPRAMLRTWGEVINAPAEWLWRDYVIMRDWAFEHGHDIGKASRATIQEETIKRFGRPLSLMRGHIHSEFGDMIKPVWIGPHRQIRAVHVGCLMDPAKCTYGRQATVNGCVVLHRGIPHPVPMLKDRYGRWTGRLGEW